MAQQRPELQARLVRDMEDALRRKDRKLLGTIRLVRAEIQRKEKDQQCVLDDAHTVQLLMRMIKQREDAIEQYEKAGREDLAQAERDEIQVIQEYTPAPVSEEQINAAIEQAIAAVGATGMRDMSRVMASARAALPAAPAGTLASMIKKRLS